MNNRELELALQTKIFVNALSCFGDETCGKTRLIHCVITFRFRVSAYSFAYMVIVCGVQFR
jgi:hypothetical protein